MRKSDKKLDNQLRLALTEVCEGALGNIKGFQWLTHVVEYSRFPDSLRVICVFDTNENLKNYLKSDANCYLQALIKFKCKKAGFTFKNIEKCIFLDTEEACDIQHKGNWSLRL